MNLLGLLDILIPIVLLAVSVLVLGSIFRGAVGYDNTTEFNKKFTTLTRIKCLSNDSKEIEEFLTKHIGYLNQDMINSLILRLEELRADNIIEEDLLKTRIDALDNSEIINEEILLEKKML